MNKKILFLIFCFIFIWNTVLLLFKDSVKVEKSFEILAKSTPDTEMNGVAELIAVYNHTNGVVEDIPLEEYIARVLSAEMPVSYGLEALKAQAVAARTYTLYCMNKNRENIHSADVCTDYKHCQAYKSSDEFSEQFNKSQIDLIYRAVEETKGEILTFENRPINAVYHASSDCYTEDAEQVWGSEVPYLLSVSSPNENGMPGFYSKISLSFDGFIEKLEYAGYECHFPTGNINLHRNDSGRVKYIVVEQIGGNNVTVPGTEVRKIFSLRSCTFDVTIDENNVVFDVSGYGHGVGMSQYGAKIMAESGIAYSDILKHYYSGCEIVNMDTIVNI
ncbi:MAG: stage II sporulation protein D [Ruminococcaceae bacterium]|nr:stage II sporulation protein D [Oscillospiraceae bacterium]